MIYKILIVGLGNIGLRHYESLNNSKYNIDILIYDINKKSYTKINKNKKNHKTTFISDLRKLNHKNFFLTIISTPAFHRLEICKKITRLSNSKYFIIEKILEQSENRLNELAKLFKNKRNCWVNTPFPVSEPFKKIKRFLPKNLNEIYVNGYNWNLASNFIHFVSLVDYFFDQKKIHNILIDKNSYWALSKRENFREFYGTIRIKFRKVTLILTNRLNRENINKKFSIKISNRINKITYNQDSEFFKINNKKINCSKITLQSNLTKIYLKQLIKENKLELNRLNKSVNLHIPVINAFKKHFNENNEKKIQLIGIT